MNIFYSMCGEGLGHCARSIALMEKMPEYNFHVFTYGEAYQFLLKNTPSNVELYQIQGLNFVENQGQINIFATIVDCLKFYFGGQLNENIQLIQSKAQELKPILFLFDWEPTLSRVGRLLGIPSISIDSQHKFRFGDMHGCPLPLKIYGWLTGIFAGWMIPHADHYVISTYQSALLEKQPNITLAQCFIRKEIENIEPSHGNHLLVYIRQKEIAHKLLSCLPSGFKVICYGVDLSEAFPWVQFKEKSYLEFVNDLASCKAVFSTAGIQLVGEAAFYGKPSFVVPIPGQYEQLINGYDADRLMLGRFIELKNLNRETVIGFLKFYGEGIPNLCNGVQEAVNVISNYIG